MVTYNCDLHISEEGGPRSAQGYFLSYRAERKPRLRETLIKEKSKRNRRVLVRLNDLFRHQAVNAKHQYEQKKAEIHKSSRKIWNGRLFFM